MVFFNSSLYLAGLFLLDMCAFPFCFFLSLILTHLSTFLVYIQPEIFNVNDGFWDPRITEQTKFNGKNYFVNSYYSPYVPTASIVVYNKKIFNDNGLTSPVDYINQDNWTWETFKQCMSDADKIGYYGGVLDPELMARTMGPGFMSYDAKTSKVICNKNNDAMLKALKFYAECREEGLVGNYLIAQYPAGNIAMLNVFRRLRL